jgi:hypothetical protein
LDAHRPGAGAAGDISLATYDERVAPAKRAARDQSLKSFISHVKASMAATVESVEQGKKSVNEMRLAGMDWIQASDKEQFDMPFYDHVDTLITAEDRKFISPDVVKTALQLARALPKPVSTPAETAEHIQKPLFAFEVMARPERQASCKAIEIDWGTRIPLQFAKVNAFIQDLLQAEPKDAWSLDRWATVEAQTEFAAQLNAEAKQKLKQ